MHKRYCVLLPQNKTKKKGKKRGQSQEAHKQPWLGVKALHRYACAFLALAQICGLFNSLSSRGERAVEGIFIYIAQRLPKAMFEFGPRNVVPRDERVV